MLESSIPAPVMGLARKVFPSLAPFLDMLEDADKLHVYVSAAVRQLQEVLEFDHKYGIDPGCQCTSTAERPAEETSAESVYSGHDELREKYIDGSIVQ